MSCLSYAFIDCVYVLSYAQAFTAGLYSFQPTGIFYILIFYCYKYSHGIYRFGNTSIVHNSFDRWSMTNIPQQSPKCRLHLIGIYIFSIITIYFLEQEFVVYAKYRHNYLRQVLYQNMIRNFS
jgi:hypothetical protein